MSRRIGTEGAAVAEQRRELAHGTYMGAVLFNARQPARSREAGAKVERDVLNNRVAIPTTGRS